MMHYATDKNFNVYLATIKGDPKTVQITHHRSIALLIHKSEPDIDDSKEVEVSGKGLYRCG